MNDHDTIREALAQARASCFSGDAEEQATQLRRAAERLVGRAFVAVPREEEVPE